MRQTPEQILANYIAALVHDPRRPDKYREHAREVLKRFRENGYGIAEQMEMDVDG